MATSYRKLLNEELMQYVIEHCDKPEAAQLLRTRWMDFWEHVQRKFGEGSMPDKLLKQYHRIQWRKKELIRLEQKMDWVEEQIRLRQEELKKVTDSDFHRLKRQVYEAHSQLRKILEKNDDLLRKMDKMKHRVWLYEKQNRERAAAETSLQRVQKKLIQENLACIDRHMHRLALVEAGLLDAALTIPGKNDTPIES